MELLNKNIFIDILMRFLATCAIGYFAFNLWKAYIFTNQKLLLLLFIVELFTVCLIIFAKRTNTRDFSLPSILFTIIATFYFFVVYLGQGIELIPNTLAQIIMVCGISWQLISKVYLGRNFGLLPACRNVVTSGPYKIVRHPIYLGYFITHMGYLLGSFSFYNLIIYIILYICQFGRIYYEERTLSYSLEYSSYKLKVKYRFIPFII